MDSAHMLAWLSWAFTRVARIGTGLLSNRAFWASLVATLIGVLVAFELERWRERRDAREQYARHLSAVRYESAQLHSACQQALAGIGQGAITTYEIDAPALRGLVSGPALQEHAPHGLSVVLISLLALVGATHNSVNHYRRLIGAGALSILATQLAPLTKHLKQLQAGIENAQGRPGTPAAQARGQGIRRGQGGH